MNAWKRQRQALLPLLPVMAGAVLLCLLVSIAVRLSDKASARTTVDQPELAGFDDRTQANYSVPVPSLTPTVTIEVPADSLGRKFIGVGEGVIITVSAHGTTDPVTVDLGQRPAGSGSQGVVFYGDAGANTTASVTTSGGTNNIAQIRVQGDAEHLSAFQGDLNLTASVGGTEVTTQQVTVTSITLDQHFITLLTDMTITCTVMVTPAGPVRYSVKFFRPVSKDGSVMVETFQSVNVIPLDGPTLETDANGIGRFRVQTGIGGEALVVWGKVTVESEGVATATASFEVIPEEEEKCECCDCPRDRQDSGKKSVALYSGEKALDITDLTIPGRGFDYQFTRSYRSQSSHLRPAATNDFGSTGPSAIAMTGSSQMATTSSSFAIPCAPACLSPPPRRGSFSHR